MQSTQCTLGGRVWTALVAASASLLLVGTTLTGAAWADQEQGQTTAASQQPEALGAHTHQVHGTVKTVPSSGSSTFVVTTKRFGDVTVSLAGATTAPANGHGHGHGKGSNAAGTSSAANLKTGDRVVVHGSTSADGKTFTATRMHVLPPQDAAQQSSQGTAQHTTHLAGTVTSAATSNGTTTLSIKLADGTSQSITVSSTTRIRPAGKTAADLTIGTNVTVVQRNGAAATVVALPA